MIDYLTSQEGKPVAALFAEDRVKTIGHVYLWGTGELSILWAGKNRNAKRVFPPIDPHVLRKASPFMSGDVFRLLSDLSAKS